MERYSDKKRKSIFTEALQGKDIPVLTLDHKWYRLFDEVGKREVKKLSEQLNSLLRKQGRLNTEAKNIRKIKKKLMNEIVPMVNDAEQNQNAEIEKKIEKHKRLIEECNEKLEKCQDELKELPGEIQRVNYQLMILTMECCYDTMQRNSNEIKDVEDWVTEIRIELKKRLIEKQEMEQRNHVIYSYMHDVFGAEVLDLFDMKYNPEKQHPRIPKDNHPN